MTGILLALMASLVHGDATDSVKLSIVGSWDKPSKSLQVVDWGDTLLWSAGLDSGVELFDVRDPAAIKRLASYKDGRPSSHVVPWKGKVLFAHADAGSTILLERTSDSTFKPVDSIVTSEGPGSVELAVSDTLVYAAIYKAGLGIYHLGENGKFERLSYLALSTTGIWSVSIKDTIAFVSLGTGGTAVVSVKDPRKPVLLKTIPIRSSTYNVFQAFARDTALWTIETNGLVAGYSVRDPAAPYFLGSLKLSELLRRMALKGNLAFVTNPSGVHVVDISVPAVPVLAGTLASQSGMIRPSGIAVTDTRVYIGNESSGITILSWSKVTKPILKSPSTSMVSRVGNVEFAWSPRDTGKSTITISANSNLSSPLLVLKTTDTTLTFKINDPGKYYWNVVSTKGIASLVGAFQLVSDSVPLPVVYGGKTVGDTLLSFSWSKPSGFSGKYELELARTIDFTGSLTFQTSDTALRMSAILGVGKWYWRVKAGTATSPVDSFVVVAIVGVQPRALNTPLIRNEQGFLVVHTSLPVEIRDLGGVLLARGESSNGEVRIALAGRIRPGAVLVRIGNTARPWIVAGP